MRIGQIAAQSILRNEFNWFSAALAQRTGIKPPTGLLLSSSVFNPTPAPPALVQKRTITLFNTKKLPINNQGNRLIATEPVMSSPATRRTASKSPVPREDQQPLTSSSSSSSNSPISTAQTNNQGGNEQQSGPKDPHEYPRYSSDWWKEWTIIFIVFSITGSTSVKFTRPLVTSIMGDGTFFGGPWYWTLCYICFTMPICEFEAEVVQILLGSG